jgi:hypothetical protein
MSAPVRTLAERTRRPTGLPSNPVILLSGGDATGKTAQSVLLTASPRIGQAWMVQLNETDGDHYGAMVDHLDRPVRYDLLDHNGTWPDIMATLTQARDEAAALVAADPGGPPPGLIFDSGSAEWAMLSAWAEARARKSKAARRAVLEDPNAKIEIGPTYWNPATRRHNDLMAVLRSFPGVVIITARGKFVSEIGSDGNPVAGAKKQWTIEAHKSLGHQVSAHVRLSQDEPPTILSARFPRGPLGINIVPGVDAPVVWDSRRYERLKDHPFTLEALVFDFLGYDPAATEARRLYTPVPGDEPDAGELADHAGVSRTAWDFKTRIEAATTLDDLRQIHREIGAAKHRQEITDSDVTFLGAIRDGQVETIKAAQPPALATAVADAAQATTAPTDAPPAAGPTPGTDSKETF